MHRSVLIVLVAFVLSACGGSSQPMESSNGGDGPSPTAGGSGGGGSGESGDAADNDQQFQLSDSDDASQAHGDHPSEIEATETEAAVRLFVVDPETGPIEDIVIKMVSPGGGVYYTRPTDSVGYAEVLVPIGQRYEMEYLSLGHRNTTAAVEIPSRPNYDVRLTLRYRRIRPAPAPEEPERFVLDGVTFETNSATISQSSYARLDRIVEYMEHKPDARIRIGGHTDNVGNARVNQRLSQRRADAVREYVIDHGIDGSRIEAIGYGDQQPVASNDTEEGRAQNRRIEAIEL